MVIVGVILIIFGVTLLIVVDAPRRVAAKFMRLGGRGADSRPTNTPPASVASVASPTVVSNSARPASDFVATPGAVAAPADLWSAYRTLAPGWYRQPTDPSVARYWDGDSLHNEKRTVLSCPTPVSIDAASGAYRGLPPGWYRDDSAPGWARFWNGSSLGEERRPVAR